MKKLEYDKALRLKEMKSKGEITHMLKRCLI
jgi:hypothetical protein